MDDDLDPLALDQDIAKTAFRARRWVRRIQTGRGLDEDPFEVTRRASGRSTFLVVEGLPEADPLREPLRRWVYLLTDSRVNRAAIAAVNEAYRSAPRPIDAPERGEHTAASILGRALAEPGRRAAWLDAYSSAARPVAELARLLWQRRREVAARMGVDGVDSITSVGVELEPVARAWLDRTDDAFLSGEPNTLAALVDEAMAPGASEGWPGRLSIDTLVGFFRETDLFRSLDLDPGPLPERLSAASYVRALRRLGAAWVDATAPSDQPFVIANDPFGSRRRTIGALFGALALEPSFVRRFLGLGASALDAHQRSMARALLIDSRLAALRVLLRSHALEGSDAFCDAFPELGERALGIALGGELAGALFRLHLDDAQRFTALFLARDRATALRDDHDEDWYRNPRAAEELRAEAALSPEPSTTREALERGAEAFFSSLAPAL